MNCINVFGLGFMVLILLPNIIYAIKCKDGFRNKYQNNVIEFLEQMGRIACMVFMILIIPGIEFGFASNELFALYLIINTILILVYLLIWVVCFRDNTVYRALALSMLPSAVFLVSGVMSRYIPLVIAALVFAPCHIFISYKNAEKIKSNR